MILARQLAAIAGRAKVRLALFRIVVVVPASGVVSAEGLSLHRDFSFSSSFARSSATLPPTPPRPAGPFGTSSRITFPTPTLYRTPRRVPPRINDPNADRQTSSSSSLITPRLPSARSFRTPLRSPSPFLRKVALTEQTKADVASDKKAQRVGHKSMASIPF